MTPEDLLDEYAEAVRGDWSFFDGRSCKIDLNYISDLIRRTKGEILSEDEISRARGNLGLCQKGCGHWEEHCD